MKKNSFFVAFITFVGFFGMGHSTSQGKEMPLSEGYYQLAVPALYPSPEEDTYDPLLSRVSKHGKYTYKINLLYGQSGELYIKWEGGEDFSIIPKMVIPGIKASGQARVVGPGTLKGEMTVHSYAPSGFMVEIRRGEWSLRPATEREVQRRFAESLAGSAEIAYERGNISLSEAKNIGDLDTPKKKEIVRWAAKGIELEPAKGFQWVREGAVKTNPEANGIEFELTTGPPSDESRGPEVDPTIQEEQKYLSQEEIEAVKAKEGRMRRKLAQAQSGDEEGPEAPQAKEPEPETAPESQPESKPRSPEISHEVETETGFLYWSWKEWLVGLIVLVLGIGGGIWWWRRRG